MEEDPVDPVDILASAERAFNAQTETRLRKRLQGASAEFFERAVIDLLWAMGYGGEHGEKKHVGRSGDGGIDGIIRQDALGLTSVYVQAKRYCETNKVGSSEMRNFIGALDSRGATQGVFITTSSFLPSAIKTAEGYRHGAIVLVDGIKLTALMLAYGVAVRKVCEFMLYEIDDDFFEEDELV
ncbi:MAG: restriction endonuclease [Actinomycetaceae bacterium]|nr:restriction endonuclease [Actinomycetaceae bacterium]